MTGITATAEAAATIAISKVVVSPALRNGSVVAPASVRTRKKRAIVSSWMNRINFRRRP